MSTKKWKLNVISFPERNLADVPASLRRMADAIDQGKYGDVNNIAWVIDCGDSEIRLGLFGAAPEPAMTAYYLLGVGMRKLEEI